VEFAISHASIFLSSISTLQFGKASFHFLSFCSVILSKDNFSLLKNIFSSEFSSEFSSVISMASGESNFFYLS